MLEGRTYWDAKKLLNAIALLFVFAHSPITLAQQIPETLEPLPSDTNKRIYYGEYYDPQKYLKCREEWIKSGRDPRTDGCLAYKERLEPFDPARRDHFGEFYSPQKFHDCRARVEARDMQCNYLKVRRRDAPEYWPYQNVPRPKLPPAPSTPVYKKGMKSKEYFDALCKVEAGEFIYKTVENVEGIYQVRPRAWADHDALRDRYVLEDPYGYTGPEGEGSPNIFLGPKKYRFFEMPIDGERVRDVALDGKYYDASIFLRPGPGEAVVRYFGYDDRSRKSLKKEYGSKLKSRYGYTWREIKRPRDRENAIVGGELIVLDLQTNEVLGIRRGFIISGNVRNVRSGIQWEIGTVCPRLTDRPGWAKDFDFTYWFVSKVLKPAKSTAGRSDPVERK